MRRHLFIVLFVSSIATVCAPRAAAAALDVVLRPPTDAPVLDPFRLPNGPYGAGNRGIEYATRDGDRITAAGPGLVVFAGPVAGSLHVTVDHGGGLRTSYSFVASVTVRRGDHVQAGELVAVAAGPFHFGARVDDRYVDPAGLFGRRRVSVRLVGHDDPSADERWLDIVERSERLEFLAAIGEGEGGVGFGLGGLVDIARAVVGAVEGVDPVGLLGSTGPRELLDDLVHIAELMATSYEALAPLASLEAMVAVAMAVLRPPECTPGGVTPRRSRGRRLALVLDGLGSSSDGGESMAQLDLGAHGYAEHDTHRFSYAGGLVDDGATPGGVGASTYGPRDTHGEIETMIARLVTTLEQLAAAHPGVVIDVYGHSLGGLIARHAVAAVGGISGPVPVGVVITLGSPHEGAPAAEILEAGEVSQVGRVVERAVGLVPDSPVGRPIIEDLSVSGYAGDHVDVAFPEGVHAVSIADRGDLVVPASVTQAPGAHQVVLGGAPSAGAHSDLPGRADVPREIELALAGLPPACEGALDRAMDRAQPFLIERAEHAVGAAVLVGGLEASRP